MNSTAKWVMCGASLGLALGASWADAASPTLAPQWAMLAATAANDADVEAGYLSQARDAMKTGRYDDAEGFIKRAEALNVKQDVLKAAWKDSPAKARAELNKLRAAGAATPSSRFSAWPPSVNKPQPTMGEAPRDPFAARASDATINRMTDDSKSKDASTLR